MRPIDRSMRPIDRSMRPIDRSGLETDDDGEDPRTLAAAAVRAEAEVMSGEGDPEGAWETLARMFPTALHTLGEHDPEVIALRGALSSPGSTDA